MRLSDADKAQLDAWISRLEDTNHELTKQLAIATKERDEARRQLAHITDTIKIDEDE